LHEVITPEYQQRMFADYYNWAAGQGKESAVAHKFREIHQHTGILACCALAPPRPSRTLLRTNWAGRFYRLRFP
jgi:hypothetical protein